MRWSIPDCAVKSTFFLAGLLLLPGSLPVLGQGARFVVPTKPPTGATATEVRDPKFGVRFEVPPGWSFTRKDREVSTFRLDARSATPASQMRGVATLDFNPYPGSVLSGALVYFSVERHSSDGECAAQATGPVAARSAEPRSNGLASHQPMGNQDTRIDTARIGGMPFVHGHDEHGEMCVEARDEVYTAFRKGSCYRFDLTVNTFCSVSSGAEELSAEQMHALEAQMTGILSTVALDWEKAGPEPVPVPEVPVETGPARGTPGPGRELPNSPVRRMPGLGVGL